MNIADTIKNASKQGAHRPFDKAPMIKTPPKPTDPSKLEICDDPIPNHRAGGGNKYEEKLKALKFGQAIKCEPSEVGRVSSAMRKWIASHKLDGTCKSMNDYGDGKGRVWLIANPKPAAVEGATQS